jgi:hypothetical protein
VFQFLPPLLFPETSFFLSMRRSAPSRCSFMRPFVMIVLLAVAAAVGLTAVGLNNSIEDGPMVLSSAQNPPSRDVTLERADGVFAHGEETTGDPPIFVPTISGSMVLAVVSLAGMSESELGTFAGVLAGWVEHLLVPQRRMHVALIIDGKTQGGRSVVQAIGLEQLNTTHLTLPRPNRFPITLLAVHSAGDERQSVAEDEEDVKNQCCACGSDRLQARARVERWLSLDFFEHVLVRQYAYVLQLQPDTWFFRRPRFSLIAEMTQHSAFLAHIGESSRAAPSGVPARCSHVHEALSNHFSTKGVVKSQPTAGGGSKALAVFGRLDIGFVLVDARYFAKSSDSAPADSAEVRARRLLESLIRAGGGQQLFTSHGWRSANLWALALVHAHYELLSQQGLVLAENETVGRGGVKLKEEAAVGQLKTRVRDLQWMLWQPRVMRRNAVLYHGSASRPINEIKQWTRLRWSRVVRETTNF